VDKQNQYTIDNTITMTDFANMRVWSDEDATSINPICLDDVVDESYETELAETKQKKKSDKKKRRRRRKKASEDDSSVADSMLSSILSESDELGDGDLGKQNMMTVDETVPSPQTNYDEKRRNEKQRRRERLEELKSRRNSPKKQLQPMRTSLYSSSDEDSDDDLSKNPFSDQNTVTDDDLSNTHFREQNESTVVDDDDETTVADDNDETTVADDDDETTVADDDKDETTVADDDLSKNPFSDRNETTVADDDLTLNPFSDNNAGVNNNSSNPFADDSTRDRAVSDSDESSAVLPSPKATDHEEQAKTTKGTNPFGDEDDEVQTDEDDMMTVQSGEQIELILQESKEEESDDEDVIQSSKRLLRCVDQRIQYQQQNDEVHSLKAQMKQMMTQAEGMAEQLRRAIETKCDLVLAQNEMERRHEQGQIVKDAELRDLRIYIQEILELQARSELDFMNEISSLARTLELNKTKHAKEIEEKESKISRLETRIESTKVSSVRGSSSEAFRNRFSDISGKNMFVRPSYE